jgi:hypothetical protein
MHTTGAAPGVRATGLSLKPSFRGLQREVAMRTLRIVERERNAKGAALGGCGRSLLLRQVVANRDQRPVALFNDFLHPINIERFPVCAYGKGVSRIMGGLSQSDQFARQSSILQFKWRDFFQQRPSCVEEAEHRVPRHVTWIKFECLNRLCSSASEVFDRCLYNLQDKRKPRIRPSAMLFSGLGCLPDAERNSYRQREYRSNGLHPTGPLLTGKPGQKTQLLHGLPLLLRGEV